MASKEDPTTDQLADQLTMSRTHVSHLADSGALPTYIEAGIRRVRPADADAFERQRAADRAELAQRFTDANNTHDSAVAELLHDE